MTTYRRAIYRIEARVDGPVRARRFVERELEHDISAAVVEDVKLLVSELVTNGIRHGSSHPRDVITIELIVDGTIQCAVSDRGRGFAAARAAPSGPESGWGLGLVEQIAETWGLNHSPTETRVWFEVADPA